MEVPLPYPRDPQLLQGGEQGEEVTGVVVVPLGGMLLEIDLPFLQHEPLQQGLDQSLKLIEEPL